MQPHNEWVGTRQVIDPCAECDQSLHALPFWYHPISFHGFYLILLIVIALIVLVRPQRISIHNIFTIGMVGGKSLYIYEEFP